MPLWDTNVKKLKFAGFALILVLVLATSLAAQITFRFDLLVNPINRHILTEAPGPWGARISLIPKPFPLAVLKVDVERRLEKAGYQRSDLKSFPGFPDLNEIDAEIGQGGIIYIREANDFVCNKTIYVFVSFDEKDLLVRGESAIYENGCL